jgi:hypothetical protein
MRYTQSHNLPAFANPFFLRGEKSLAVEKPLTSTVRLGLLVFKKNISSGCPLGPTGKAVQIRCGPATVSGNESRMRSLI